MTDSKETLEWKFCQSYGEDDSPEGGFELDLIPLGTNHHHHTQGALLALFPGDFPVLFFLFGFLS